MRSIALVPYSPYPATSGACVEMQKHLKVLRELGDCTIASAAALPVGAGWTEEAVATAKNAGITLSLRETALPASSWRQRLGIAYGAICKALGWERAFGHSNPYHRLAFPRQWWLAASRDADIALINYSYWAWLPTACPKVVVLHDLLSAKMWEGPGRETAELGQADLVVVISKDEEVELKRRGLANVLWSPPLVTAIDAPLSASLGLVGSANPFNREGLRWLQSVAAPADLPLTIYGALGQFSRWSVGSIVASYADGETPYRQCGIILLPTALGTGVQIKAVEALAGGRAIIARRGAMRGLPAGDGAWITVDTPAEMIAAARHLLDDPDRLAELAFRARMYYQQHLDAATGLETLRKAYAALVSK